MAPLSLGTRLHLTTSGISLGTGVSIGTGLEGSVGSSLYPLTLPNTELYLDATVASSITKDGSNLVSQWNDLSPKGRHVTATGADRPTYDDDGFYGVGESSGGAPTLEFDGTEFLSYEQAFGEFTAGTTITVVGSFSDLQNNQFERILAGIPTSGTGAAFQEVGGFTLIPSQGFRLQNAAIDTRSDTDKNPNIEDQEQWVYTIRLNPDGSTATKMWLNGAVLPSDGDTLSAPLNMAGIIIGGNFTGSVSGDHPGKISAVHISSQPLTDAQVEALHADLLLRHKVRWTPRWFWANDVLAGAYNPGIAATLTKNGQAIETIECQYSTGPDMDQTQTLTSNLGAADGTIASGVQIDDTNVPIANRTAADAVFRFVSTIPSTDCFAFEVGGGSQGAYVAVESGELVAQCGNGTAGTEQARATTTLTAADTAGEHEIVVWIDDSADTVYLYVDGILRASDTASAGFPSNVWAGTQGGMFDGVVVGSAPPSMPTTAWAGTVNGSLEYWQDAISQDSAQPTTGTDSLNGYDVLELTDPQFMNAASAQVTPKFILAVGLGNSSLGNVDGFLNRGSGGGDWNIWYNGSSGFRDENSPWSDANYAFSDGNYWINGADTAAFTLNEAFILSAQGGTQAAGYNTSNVMRISQSFLSRHWEGYLAHLITLDALPSTATRQAYEGWAENRFGLTLATGHPFKDRIPLWSGGSVAAAFHPSDLLTGGRVGFVLEPGPTTCYQEITGDIDTLTPSGVGDPVGTIADTSGAGNHWRAPSTSARFTLQQDSGKYYLTATTSDQLTQDSFDSVDGECTFFFASDTSRSAYILLLEGGSSDPWLFAAQDGSANAALGSGATLDALYIDNVLTAVSTRDDAHTETQGQHTIMIDATLIGGGGTDWTGIPKTIGAYDGTFNALERYYAVAGFSTKLSAEERAQMHTWGNSRMP